jgi:hypothetical protein
MDDKLLRKLDVENKWFAEYMGYKVVKENGNVKFQQEGKTLLEVNYSKFDDEIRIDISKPVIEKLTAVNKGFYMQALNMKIEPVLQFNERMIYASDMILLSKFVLVSKKGIRETMRFYSFCLQEVVYKSEVLWNILHEEYRNYMNIILN